MDLNKKCVFILTGASKGIGKTMAIECSRHFKGNSLVILLARSNEGLENTKRQILALRNDITVKVYPLDLSIATSKDYARVLDDALVGLVISDFERAFIIHNVGSVGNVSKSINELSDIESWKQYYHLNVFGVSALNVEFMNCFKAIPKLVVNITSKCGVVPFAGMVEYCAGKAAREMYFRVLAEEQPDTIVLNYSPGPVDTDMTVRIQNDAERKDLRKMFENLREQKTILTTELTTARFLKVLKEFKFKSGDHIDYYD